MSKASPGTGREPHIVLPRLSHRLTQTSFPQSKVADTIGLGREVLNMLPPLSEAVKLCEVSLEYGKFLEYALVLPISGVQRTDTHTDRSENFRQYHPLALLFITFTLAPLFDPQKEPMNVEAREWFYLARTSLQLASPVRETTLTAIQAMYLDLVDSGVSGDNEAWMYIGLSYVCTSALSRLSRSYNSLMDLNAARWGLNEEIVERRNRVFWPLFVLDTASTLVDHLGCRWRTPTVLFRKIKRRQCFLMGVFSLATRRGIGIPVPRRPTCEDGIPNAKLESWLILFTRETTLLNLHHACFTQALSETPRDPSKYRFIPSVVVIYCSAWRISRTLEITLSAAIVMCLITTKAPLSLLAQPALEEHYMIKVFKKAAPLCTMAARLLPSLKRISRKAQEMLRRASPHPYALDDSAVIPAELDRLGGKTHLLSSRDDDITGFYAPSSGAVPITLANPTSPSNTSSITLSDGFFEPFANLNMYPQNLHPTIKQNMRKFAVRNELGPGTGTRGLFDYPSSSSAAQEGQAAGFGAFEQLMTEVQEQERAFTNRAGEQALS
ncbi:hypothetical protein BDQ17DRAFT_1435765 [Cyathus striatus]|nr:hypothetical protein BDQ17DRAFT_1435765 [Cyathus striatus]